MPGRGSDTRETSGDAIEALPAPQAGTDRATRLGIEPDRVAHRATAQVQAGRPFDPRDIQPEQLVPLLATPGGGRVND